MVVVVAAAAASASASASAAAAVVVAVAVAVAAAVAVAVAVAVALVGSFSKIRRRRQRERQLTKGLMSRTMVLHVRFDSLYIFSKYIKIHFSNNYSKLLQATKQSCKRTTKRLFICETMETHV